MDALAQPKIGFLHSGSKQPFRKHFRAFRRRLEDLVDDDIRIDDRWATDDTALTLLEHAQQLANDSTVKVIVAAGGPQPALDAKTATTSNKKPVVFTTVVDPAKLGLVDSLDKPVTNLTGTAGLTSELDVPRLELLNELLVRGPNDQRMIGVLNNKKRTELVFWKQLLVDAATRMRLNLTHQDVEDLNEIKTAFTNFRTSAVDAVLVTADSLFNNLREEVIKLSQRQGPNPNQKAIPTIYQWREFAEDGGLMSYGPNIIDAYETAADYVKRIFVDGKKPQDDPPTLPVSLPDRFELVINLRTARAGNFSIPASLLTRAVFVRRPLR
jgi:putative ABC transport system substrate-binding protein